MQTGLGLMLGFDSATIFCIFTKPHQTMPIAHRTQHTIQYDGVMLFNASSACNARKLYVIGTDDVVAGIH